MQRGQKDRGKVRKTRGEVSLGKLSAGPGSICHRKDVGFQKFTLSIKLPFLKVTSRELLPAGWRPCFKGAFFVFLFSAAKPLISVMFYCTCLCVLSLGRSAHKCIKKSCECERVCVANPLAVNRLEGNGPSLMRD